MIQASDNGNESRTQVLIRLGDVLFHDGDYTAALDCFIQAMEALPEPREKHRLSARIYQSIAVVCEYTGNRRHARAARMQAGRCVGTAEETY
jgi:hypothetical protein